MVKKFSILQKTLTFGIFILFIGMGVVSPTGKNIESVDNNPSKFDNNQKMLQASEHLVYFGAPTNHLWECAFYKGTLNDIENSTCICYGSEVSGDLISGCTWTNDARLIGCEYGTGRLWEIDYNTCDMYLIGGGGYGLNGIAYDPTSEIMYGCSSEALYEVNASTGEQSYIGDFGDGPSYMIGLSFDADGELYGWDVGTDSLWTIDIDTGNTFFVGSLGIDLNGAQDGDFCKVDDILYLAAYMSSPQSGPYLVECDKNTGECTIISQFPDSSQDITEFVIPWNFHPYAPSNYSPCGDVEVPFNMSWDGGDPDSEDMVTYYIYLGLYEPPTILFATVGPYPANQKLIEFGPVTLPLFETYYWKVVACDNYGDCAVGPTCTFTTYCIFPPNEPTIEGPSKGKPGIIYDYSFVSTNPINFTIKYHIEWGDGNISETGYFESGEIVTLNHSWEEKRTYIIKAKAIDTYDQESDWSYHEVLIPRGRVFSIKNIYLNWFLERFQLLKFLIIP